MTPKGGPDQSILEMGAYLQITPSLKTMLGYGCVRGCYYGPAGETDHLEAVSIDGERIGETPVSQLSLPIGIHEIVFRHPEHGERRTSVIVKIGATGRAFADFTK